MSPDPDHYSSLVAVGRDDVAGSRAARVDGEAVESCWCLLTIVSY